MTTYLATFFKEFAYNAADAAYLCAAYDRVAAEPEAQVCFAQALALYDEDMHADYARILSLADTAAMLTGLQEYTTELLVFIAMSKTLRERYRERGLADTIFFDSMLDLRYKLEECKVVKGIIGSFVASWFAGFFDMTRFGFGRLQFELVPFNGEYEKDGKRLSPDSKVINVHIPRTGTPLDKASCDAAFAQAGAFFADEIDGDIAFVCSSWLLYPENETILPPHSNIVRFMKAFDMLSHGISKNKADLWRLFDTDESHPDRLPTDTTARRLYAAHLKAGGKLGWGYGVFFA